MVSALAKEISDHFTLVTATKAFEGHVLSVDNKPWNLSVETNFIVLKSSEPSSEATKNERDYKFHINVAKEDQPKAWGIAAAICAEHGLTGTKVLKEGHSGKLSPRKEEQNKKFITIYHNKDLEAEKFLEAVVAIEMEFEKENIKPADLPKYDGKLTVQGQQLNYTSYRKDVAGSRFQFYVASREDPFLNYFRVDHTNEKDEEGRIPLHYAMIGGREGVSQGVIDTLLRDEPADSKKNSQPILQRKDDSGKTPLDYLMNNDEHTARKVLRSIEPYMKESNLPLVIPNEEIFKTEEGFIDVVNTMAKLELISRETVTKVEQRYHSSEDELSTPSSTSSDSSDSEEKSETKHDSESTQAREKAEFKEKAQFAAPEKKESVVSSKPKFSISLPNFKPTPGTFTQTSRSTDIGDTTARSREEASDIKKNAEPTLSEKNEPVVPSKPKFSITLPNFKPTPGTFPQTSRSTNLGDITDRSPEETSEIKKNAEPTLSEKKESVVPLKPKFSIALPNFKPTAAPSQQIPRNSNTGNITSRFRNEINNSKQTAEPTEEEKNIPSPPPTPGPNK